MGKESWCVQTAILTSCRTAAIGPKSDVTKAWSDVRFQGQSGRGADALSLQFMTQSRLGRLINRGSHCDRMIYIFSKSKVIAYGLKKSCPTMPAK